MDRGTFSECSGIKVDAAARENKNRGSIIDARFQLEINECKRDVVSDSPKAKCAVCAPDIGNFFLKIFTGCLNILKSRSSLFHLFVWYFTLSHIETNNKTRSNMSISDQRRYWYSQWHILNNNRFSLYLVIEGILQEWKMLRCHNFVYLEIRCRCRPIVGDYFSILL